MGKSKLLLAGMALFMASGCASIVSKSNYPVKINSTPTGVPFTIISETGQVVHKGETPQTVTLSAKGGFFEGMGYRVEFNKPGRETYTQLITPKLDGWYAGNIFIGGLLGMLIIDPATGAMYKLPREVGVHYGPDKETVEEAPTPEDDNVSGATISDLEIITIDQLSDDEIARLVEVG